MNARLDENLQVPEGCECVKHLKNGLMIDGSAATELEASFLLSAEVDIPKFTRSIIRLIWPSTTALTYSFAPESPFNKMRLEIAAG